MPSFDSNLESDASWKPGKTCAIRIRRVTALDNHSLLHSSEARSLCIIEDGCCIDSESLPAGVKVGDVIRELKGEADVNAIVPVGSVHVQAGTGIPENMDCCYTVDISGFGLSMSITRIAGKQECTLEIIGDLMRFLHTESCGRCLFCREGLLHLRQLHEDIAIGRGETGDIDMMAQIGRNMNSHCLCSYGKAAAHLVLFGLEQHRNDYEHHIKSGACSGRGADGAD